MQGHSMKIADAAGRRIAGPPAHSAGAAASITKRADGQDLADDLQADVFLGEGAWWARCA
jgi:hypothetical protein